MKLPFALAALLLTPLAQPATAAPACAADQSGAAYLCRAVEAADHQKFAEAAESFEKAATASPGGEPQTQRMLAAAGNMWIAAGQPGKAALALDRALVGNGLQAEQRGLALLDRARAAESQYDLKGARRFFDQAAPTVDRDPFAWYFSAALAVREQDLPKAKIAIGRALSLAPTMPEALFEAGHIANAEGDSARARDYWTLAVAADPGGKIAVSANAALAELGAPLTVKSDAAKK